MRVLLVQGTWGDDDHWWTLTEGGTTFADAVVAAGHTLVGADGARRYVWSTELGGLGFGDSDLKGWRAAGRHLYDYYVPPLAPHCAPPVDDLVIVSHSHGRQVVRFALQNGLRAHTVIFVSGPVRKDVDRATPDAYAHVGHVIELNGGKADRMQWLGSLFDGHFGIRRTDKAASVHTTYKDAGHSDLLTNPAFYSRVLDHIR